MALDTSGAALGALIAAALGLPDPPTNPSPAQLASYLASKQAQIDNWTIISAQILQYITANAVVNTTDTLPLAGVATIIAPSGGGPCTGTGSGTGTGNIT
jgi:hypothetical protein